MCEEKFMSNNTEKNIKILPSKIRLFDSNGNGRFDNNGNGKFDFNGNGRYDSNGNNFSK
jgi:hypothetical protein